MHIRIAEDDTAETHVSTHLVLAEAPCESEPKTIPIIPSWRRQMNPTNLAKPPTNLAFAPTNLAKVPRLKQFTINTSRELQIVHENKTNKCTK